MRELAITPKADVLLDFGSKLILDRLSSSGFKAYLVGGAIRNYFLSKKIIDRDITTSAKIEDICTIFGDYKVVKTGEKYGTVTVVINSIPYEITTFRVDGSYLNFRKPEAVAFTDSLTEDLNRRDFTINAIAFNEIEGFVDVFGGIDDLALKTIRCVGEPGLRFKEDALRILRAVRFLSQTSFDIDINTFNAMNELKGGLLALSKERIYNELCKILTGEFSFIALEKCCNIVCEIIPEMKSIINFEQKSRAHYLDVFKHTLKAIEIAKTDDVSLAFALLFHDFGKPQTFYLDKDGFGHFPKHWIASKEIAVKILKRLKAPKKVIEECANLCYYHDHNFENDYNLKLFLNDFGIVFAKKLEKLKRADLLAHSQSGIDKYRVFFDFYSKSLDRIINNNECYSINQVNFNGNDALSLGIDAKQISKLRKAIFMEIINGNLLNDKDEIIKYLKRNII